MADAISAANLAKMRGPQWQNLYLAVDVPPTIWTGRVNGAHSQGAYDITFDGGALSGSAQPSHHFEVWFGSSAGAKDRGVTRIRNGTLPTWAVASGTLRIASNDMSLSNDDYITIKQNILPMSILPSIDGAYEDEDKAYTDENEEQHPLARIGPPACGFLSSGIHTVSFWSDDVAIASGASLSSYAWTFAGGLPTSSAIAGTAVTPIPVTYNSAGRKWVTHTVTDDNGKTHTRYTTVHVYDKDSSPPIVDFTVEGLTGDRDNGSWRCTIRVHESCTEGEFPDLAQVILFTEQYWDGTQTDIGYGWTHRENIVFVGYIVGDSVRKDPYDSSVTFEAVGICELAKQITCWGASLKDKATATWHQIPDMTLNLAAFHITTEHTTFDHIADVYLSLDTITMKYIDIGEGPYYDHMKTQIGEAGRALLMSNAKGQIYYEPNAQLALTADRPSTELWTLTTADWREGIDLGPEHNGVYQCCQVDFISFYYDGNDPKVRGSLAPGRQWPTGSVQKVTGVRADSQADTNEYAGVFEQNYNNPFTAVILPMHGYYPVLDIAPQAYIKVTLSSGDTIRGLVWSAVRHVIKTVTHTWVPEGGYFLTDATVDQEVGSYTGTTNDIPTEDPDPDPPNPDPVPDPPGPSTSVGVLLISQDKLALSVNFFDDETTEWTDITNEMEGDLLYKVVVGSNQQAYCTTDAGVYYCSNILATPPTWTVLKSLASARTETSEPSAEFRSIEITSGGSIYLAWHEWDYRLMGHWSGNAGGISYTQWSQYGVCLVRSTTTRMTWCIYPDVENVWFAAGAGGCGGAGVYKHGGGGFVQVDPVGGGGQMATNVFNGYAVEWNGWIWTAGSGYASKYSETLKANGSMGVSIVDGNLLYVGYDDTEALYQNTTPIADATVVFGAGEAGGHATYVLDTSTEIIWVVSGDIFEFEAKRIIVYTDDTFTTWTDKTGDYFTEVADPYAGTSDSAGGGNAAAVVFEY